MRRTIIIALLLISNIAILAQEESAFGIKFSGFVKNDFFYDSRQTVSAREGHFLLWPSPELLDENGVDINARSSFNFLAVQSRLSGKITGPDAFGAKTSALIEGDFFAQANANINLFRLRHAFIKLNWTNLEVLTGQYWNPLFVTDCFPGTVSFNTGTPMQSFARNPQVRVTYKFGGLKFIGAALGQRDHSTIGMEGGSSSYLRNSGVPDMHFQLHYGTGFNDEGSGIIAGAGLAYKTIVPRLNSQMGPAEPYDIYKVEEKVGGLTAMAFSKLTLQPITAKLQVRYGENISDLLAISGFAVKQIIDPVTGEQTYTPLQSMSLWGDVHTNGKKFQVGLFSGMVKNMGTKEEMFDAGNSVYGRTTNISSLIRISPRVIFNSGKARIAFEMEFTQAAYGNNYDEFYVPASTTVVTNLRGLVAVYYFF